ncbi:MAG: DinB family protein [Bacteroidota bacterium]
MARITSLLFCLWFCIPTVGVAQHADVAAGEFAAGFFNRYEYTAMRYMRLAEALPAEVYSWSPGEGAMSVEKVYMHIIRYNYLYPEMLGIAVPAGIDMDQLESMTGKDTVDQYLEDSLAYVRKMVRGSSEADLQKMVNLYGNNTQAYNVYIQLQTHMSEHLGQLMAYARMNGITPPWSN